MLSHLLPLLAISGAVASPLRPERRQDASAIVSAASAAVSGATSEVSSAVSVAASATSDTASSIMTSVASASGSYSAPMADPSAPPSQSTSASAPSVTMYPDTSAGEPIVVNGAQGLVPGVDTYLGVPFAAPRKSNILHLTFANDLAVGDLRLTPPQSPIYNSSYDATTQPPACIQSPSALSGDNYSEDCLYLNVFTPAGANAQTAFLPVMVWM
jgi:hypothetical protein